MDKALNYVALARKAGRVELGEEPVGAAARAHHARLVIVASDASDHTWRRAKSFVAGTDQLCIRRLSLDGHFVDGVAAHPNGASNGNRTLNGDGHITLDGGTVDDIAIIPDGIFCNEAGIRFILRRKCAHAHKAHQHCECQQHSN